MGEDVCCVCDCWHSSQDMEERLVATSPTIIGAMKKRLRRPEGLPPKLYQYYDVSHKVPALTGTLLSAKGVIGDHHDGFKLQLCKACYQSLTNKHLHQAPKFTIANGLYIGCLPAAFGDTTPTEHAILNLAQPTRMFSVLRLGKHTAIRAHA
ncbi:hypothetical protein L917_18740 [Phytophthora nicotianae]|uniref:DUF6570 domain-containing protein n=1 Tax=Phytophthora nicotianae TaxID=4792 RepID=W2K6K2_PHYNI|nr:hypothetical protein L917_18740 [Phytophthora nicotianae]